MISVYISGPLTNEVYADEHSNVIKASDAMCKLLKHNFAVYCPHLMWCVEEYLLDRESIPDYETFMENDFYWICKADVFLRLPGESPGADREEKYARSLAKPCCSSVEEVIEKFTSINCRFTR